MHSSQKTLFIVGTALIAFLGWLLMIYSPMPSGLALPHAGIDELSAPGGCQRCHDKEGLAAGCLHCHAEIQQQLTAGSGYHAHLLKDRPVACERCHKEHAGAEFPLVNLDSWGAQVPRAFRHPHVSFGLEGKHSMLECEACHEEKLTEKPALPGFASTPRTRTFLGLGQECRSCHEDIHSGGLTPACATCHGQDAFKPTVHFNHAERFPLIGGHEALACAECHILPDQSIAARPFPFPFEDVRGTACEECHAKPHHAAAIQRCDDCHLPAAPHWPDAIQNVSVDRHALSGFRLMGAHAGVECAKCHPRDLAFPERYPDALAPGYLRGEDTCQGCHRDVHQGQFQERHPRCLDCHDRHDFMPSTYGQEAHAVLYPLNNAHAAVACIGCHRVDPATETRKFAGTSHVCKECHAYPHGEQFRKEIADGDCTVCHSPSCDAFQIRPFDHAGRTGYALLGGHSRALCNDCHIELPEASGMRVRQYRGTDQACEGCHRDVHRGQFAPDGLNACSTCHQSFDLWQQPVFNHNTMSRFPLEGAHAAAACSRCHLSVKLPDGGSVVQYKPLGVECRDCHDVVPGSNPTAVR